jgi:hypothetical protein
VLTVRVVQTAVSRLHVCSINSTMKRASSESELAARRCFRLTDGRFNFEFCRANSSERCHWARNPYNLVHRCLCVSSRLPIKYDLMPHVLPIGVKGSECFSWPFFCAALLVAASADSTPAGMAFRIDDLLRLICGRTAAPLAYSNNQPSIRLACEYS